MAQAAPLTDFFEYLKAAGLSFAGLNLPTIDWHQAGAIALLVGDTKEAVIKEPIEELNERFHQWLKLVSPAIAEFTGLQLPKPLGQPVLFDRAEWVVTVIDRIRSLLEPLLLVLLKEADNSSSQKPASKNFVKAVLTIQLGTLLGYLSRRVLGQYDFALSGSEFSEDNGRLFFVYPNIVNVRERFELEAQEFEIWLVLHEATHGYEFEAVPWLKSYMRDLVSYHKKQIEKKISQIAKETSNSKLSSLLYRLLFSGGFSELISLEENHSLSKIQAFMAIIEGYSDYIMYKVSKKLISHSEAISNLFRRNKSSRNWAERLLEKIIGLDLKIQQYKLGYQFVSDLVSHGGMDLARQIWVKPDNLPSLTEIRNPHAWIERLGL
jgi:coenzyme F420 biosynthesis associated uncharacterized protein